MGVEGRFLIVGWCGRWRASMRRNHRERRSAWRTSNMIRSLSSHSEPAARRSAACSARRRVSARTVSSSSGITRRDRSFLALLHAAPCRSQHGATDLDAATTQPSAGSETVDPRRHVLAIEPRQLDGSETVFDVRDRPLVLLACLHHDVGATGDVPAHQPTHGAPLGRSILGLHRARRSVRRPLRRVGAELARPVLSGGGVDAIDTHDLLVALFTNRWLTCRFPRHDAPPCRSASD